MKMYLGIDIVCATHYYSGVYYNLQLTIPNKDTTYWCSVYNLPEEFASQERFIVKVIIITLLVYLNELPVALSHSLVQLFQSRLPDMYTIFLSIYAPI
jgi:hypothetical protein